MDAERDFVARMGGALTDAGMPPMPARVFAALLVAPQGRRTAAELAGVLDASPAAVSTAVRYLAQVAMLRRERVPGSRRDLYVVEDDAWHEALVRSGSRYRPMLAALETAEHDLPADSPAVRRVRLSRAFLEFLQSEIEALEPRWQERRRALGL